jgi:transposase
VRAAETVAASSRGYDAGNKVNARKRHVAVDTVGLLLCVLVTAASVQDRDGARPLLEQLRASCRRIRLVWVDGGYAGKLVDWAHTIVKLALTMVNAQTTRPDSWSCHDVGSWHGRWLGSAVIADASVTTSAYPHTTRPWSVGP